MKKTIQKINSVCLLIALFLSGCSGTNSDVSNAGNEIEGINSPGISEQITEDIKYDYILQRHDSIEIKLAYNSNFNEQVTIRPDGKISLQLIDEVEAAGLTCAQLDEILTKKYSKVLRDPQIAVIVREFTGLEVYIAGEVKKPGVINLRGKMTVLEAIYQVGGFSETAAPKSVIVISRSANNTRLVRQVDLSEALEGVGGGQQLLLRPFDVVHIPKSAIAEANKWVDQHIRQLIPVTLNAGFSYVIFNEKNP